MNQIKCPKCNTVFTISESDYAAILKQVKDETFSRELKDQLRLKDAEKQNELLKKDQQLAELKNQLAVAYADKIHEKELQISDLENTLKLQNADREQAVKAAVNEKDRLINDLNNQLKLADRQHQLDTQNLKASFADKQKIWEEELNYYKNLKIASSTKMIGESLEVHCQNEFNKLRPLFKNAYFEKDNQIVEGTKGDFIFRDFDDDQHEIVSIMFEMKNEADNTAVKHKNEDFFAKLDKDRRKKNCEYAVLVSLLEKDNDYYNDGIVDVSYRYDKMYVIRPQFFIPLITLIRSQAMKTNDLRKELEISRRQNVDVTNFEEKLLKFKDGFTKNYLTASDRFRKAIEQIDKTIDSLNKIKENLLTSENQLRLANNKVEDLTVKKLTHGNQTMKKLFNEAKSKETLTEGDE